MTDRGRPRMPEGYFCSCPKIRSATRQLQELDPDDGAFMAYLKILNAALKEFCGRG